MAKSDINRVTGKVELSRQQRGALLADWYATADKKWENYDKPKSEDTIKRMNINEDIEAMLSQGKGKIEILTFLSNKYQDTYLSKYFEQWIEYHTKKMELKAKNREEGKTR